MEEDQESHADGNSEPMAEHDNSELGYKFRNYVPQTKFLEGLCMAEKSQPGSINHLIEDKLKLISKDNDGYRIDPTLLNPKKVDWDLKRRIEKRLELLERDTRKSISKHIKDAQKKR